MEIAVIHIVTDLSKINFGIWNAALFGSNYLAEKYGVKSYLFVCDNPQANPPIIPVPVIWAGINTSLKKIEREIEKIGISRERSIVVSHGCWRQPSRVAYELKKRGFRWLYAPHGMLEPWSLSNHRLKKIIYYLLFEKRYNKEADDIRAVSKTEQGNLTTFLNRKISVIENGVVIPQVSSKPDGPTQFLFLARLHFKKGIAPLVKAWSKSMMDANAKLTIAGPDDGELNEVKSFFKGNIEYVGAVYDEQKTALLKKSHYYLLPSFSEGFPTSVVEAMSYGLIPIISSGCNFNEVFEQQLGYRIEPDENSIEAQLRFLKDISFDANRSQKNYQFIKANYSESAIGEKLYALYNQVLFNN